MTSPAEDDEKNARAEDDEKRTRALELHLAGASYSAIAKAIGYHDKSSAFRAVKKALDDQRPYTLDMSQTVEAELARLNSMLTGLWPKARRGDVQAIDRVLRIEERRSAIAEKVGPDPHNKPKTGLSEFEERLRKRESGTEAARRTSSG